MVEVMKFFEIKTTEFRMLWKELTDTDKAQLKSGIADGSLTY